MLYLAELADLDWGQWRTIYVLSFRPDDSNAARFGHLGIAATHRDGY